MSSKSTQAVNILNWIFSSILISLAILNIILIHIVPGMIYLLLSCIYLPPITKLSIQRLQFAIPPIVKIILGIFIIWFTLGMTDLMHLFESRVLK